MDFHKKSENQNIWQSKLLSDLKPTKIKVDFYKKRKKLKKERKSKYLTIKTSLWPQTNQPKWIFIKRAKIKMFEIWNLWKMFETLDLAPIIKTTWEGNISREIAILCNGNLCQWGWKAVTKNIFKDKTVWVWRIMLHSRGRLNCLVNTQIWGWKVGRFCSNQNNAESNWRRCFYHQIWCWWYHQTNLHPCPIIGSISQIRGGW